MITGVVGGGALLSLLTLQLFLSNESIDGGVSICHLLS
jgi:hypothetical protein